MCGRDGAPILGGVESKPKPIRTSWEDRDRRDRILLERLEAVRQARLEELQRFQDREPSGLVMAFEEFHNKRVAKRLASKEGEFGTTEPAPGPEALALRERLSALETSPAVTPAPDDRLALLEETAARLAGLAEDALDHAKALARATVAEEPDYARVLGDQELLLQLVDRLEAVRLDRLEAVQHLKAAEAPANGLVMSFAEFQRRVEECETRFREGPGGLRNILNKRVRRNLAPRRAEFADTAPAPEDRATWAPASSMWPRSTGTRWRCVRGSGPPLAESA
ncbi:hypothetical protein AB0929_00755 [Streptomyces massasporeus]|uniref:hypothetical protein n=1 Tax=Streptomyces massasporeus TaxID=67324 RepID=UPI003452038E